MGLNPIDVSQRDAVGLHLIVGNRGSGKGNVGMRKLSKWMLYTDRFLVTNMAIRIDPWERAGKPQKGWQAKLEEMGYEGPHVGTRVWFIPKDDLQGMHFWWHIRGNGWEIPWISKDDWKKGRRLDFRYAYRWTETEQSVSRREEFRELSQEEIDTFVERGELEKTHLKKLPQMLFAIDEMVALYPANDYMDLHPEVTYYITQMRKPPGGDQCYVFGTDGSLILKRFRTQVDDTLVLENMGKQQKFCFRLPGAVKAAKFFKFPESERAKPMVSGQFHLRAEEWGQTYDTSAGIGEGFDGGGSADIGEHRPGISYWWALAFVPVIILAVVNAREIVNWGTRAVLGKNIFGGSGGSAVVVQAKAQAVPTPVEDKSTATKMREVVGSFVQVQKKETGFDRRMVEEPELRLTGVAGPVSGVLLFYWSDGSQTTSAEREFEGRIKRGQETIGVRWAGKTYYLNALPKRETVRQFSSDGPSGERLGSL